jgi:hypothetical protein
MISTYPNGEFEAQYKRVYKYLRENPSTMLEVAVALNILRANICRYIDTMVKSDKAAIVQIRRCSISGYPSVAEYTTAPDLFPKSNQLYLF